MTEKMKNAIEGLSAPSDTVQFFKNHPLKKLSDEELGLLNIQMAKINGTSHLDGFVSIVEKEISRRDSTAWNIINSVLGGSALIVSIISLFN